MTDPSYATISTVIGYDYGTGEDIAITFNWDRYVEEMKNMNEDELECNCGCNCCDAGKCRE